MSRLMHLVARVMNDLEDEDYEEGKVISRHYVIYDLIAGESGPLFEAKNDEVAVRNFRKIMDQVPAMDKQSYVLYYVGTFDNEVLRFTPESFARQVDVKSLLEIMDSADRTVEIVGNAENQPKVAPEGAEVE